jgi:hypothetical protein
MEYDQRVIIRFLCKERASPEDIRARLEAQFGDTMHSEYSERNIQQWCQYVRQARENLHDEVQSGRPLSDFLDIRIFVLLDEQPFDSAYSIAEALGVSHSAIGCPTSGVAQRAMREVAPHARGVSRASQL